MVQVVNGTSTSFLYDGPNLMQELAGTTTLLSIVLDLLDCGVCLSFGVHVQVSVSEGFS